MKSKRPMIRNRKKKTELLTAYNEDMNEIGVFERSVVHYNGLWHKVVQCWIVDDSDPKDIRIYLQRRSFEKKSNPGRYDISAGGHVEAGESVENAMLREIREETGLILKAHDITEIGTFREISGKDCEFAHIFVCFMSVPPFSPGEEVIYMVSANADEFKSLSEGIVNEITVIPAIKTGLMTEEAFTVNPANFCNHESFVKVVYPYLKKKF
ncbi:MAG: NUDIX domain-containing protein [Firmicutes bacterium]|nr:NUDIX domain-containing protein [Bacillota bacterium]